jgi:hypothetical protein
MSFTIGQSVHLTAAFKINGVLTDPTTTTLTIKDPSGVITTPALVHDSTGNFHWDQLATLAGTYWFTFVGTGACAAAGQMTFDVAGGHTT